MKYEPEAGLYLGREKRTFALERFPDLRADTNGRICFCYPTKEAILADTCLTSFFRPVSHFSTFHFFGTNPRKRTRRKFQTFIDRMPDGISYVSLTIER